MGQDITTTNERKENIGSFQLKGSKAMPCDNIDCLVFWEQT